MFELEPDASCFVKFLDGDPEAASRRWAGDPCTDPRGDATDLALPFPLSDDLVQKPYQTNDKKARNFTYTISGLFVLTNHLSY